MTTPMTTEDLAKMFGVPTSMDDFVFKEGDSIDNGSHAFVYLSGYALVADNSPYLKWLNMSPRERKRLGLEVFK